MEEKERVGLGKMKGEREVEEKTMNAYNVIVTQEEFLVNVTFLDSKLKS
jgi:hypothetical protein